MKGWRQALDDWRYEWDREKTRRRIRHEKRRPVARAAKAMAIKERHGWDQLGFTEQARYWRLAEVALDSIFAEEPVSDAVYVEPKDLKPNSWLREERFAEFVAAYRFASSHFSRAAASFSKVTPEDAYWIWKTITTGFERNQRLGPLGRPTGVDRVEDG